MRKNIFYCMAMIVLLVSCKNNISHTVPALNASNLASTFISLNADSAYTLKTPKGAIIKIAKNTFDVDANTKVKLEIKEAYSMQDILLAGLSTTSNGKLLKSGGMIYINATADNKNINFLKPINVSIPTKNYDDSMQLFKGEVKDDSTINWVNPQPLDSSAVAKNLSLGKNLFMANCASCHKPAEDFTGPALARCRDREPNKDWVYQFISNANVMLQTDQYAKSLKQKFGGVLMTQFPQLSKIYIKDILDYCDNEGSLQKSFPDEAPKDTTKEITDSTQKPCGYDTLYYPMPDTSIQELPDTTTYIDTTTAIPVNTTTTITNPSVSLYQFNISQSGWYNIDCFIAANTNAVTTVQLTATVNNIPAGINMEVYVCIPKRKLLSDERGNTGSNYTFFNSDNDSIQLILNDDAMIVAVGGNDTKMYYGITKFTIKDKQVITVNVKESSEEEINKSIHNNKMDSIKIDPDENETVVTSQPSTQTSDSTGNISTDTTKREMQIQIVPKPCNAQYIFSEK